MCYKRKIHPSTPNMQRTLLNKSKIKTCLAGGGGCDDIVVFGGGGIGIGGIGGGVGGGAAQPHPSRRLLTNFTVSPLQPTNYNHHHHQHDHQHHYCIKVSSCIVE